MVVAGQVPAGPMLGMSAHFWERIVSDREAGLRTEGVAPGGRCELPANLQVDGVWRQGSNAAPPMSCRSSRRSMAQRPAGRARPPNTTVVPAWLRRRESGSWPAPAMWRRHRCRRWSLPSARPRLPPSQVQPAGLHVIAIDDDVSCLGHERGLIREMIGRLGCAGVRVIDLAGARPRCPVGLTRILNHSVDLIVQPGRADRRIISGVLA